MRREWRREWRGEGRGEWRAEWRAEWRGEWRKARQAAQRTKPGKDDPSVQPENRDGKENRGHGEPFRRSLGSHVEAQERLVRREDGERSLGEVGQDQTGESGGGGGGHVGW